MDETKKQDDLTATVSTDKSFIIVDGRRLPKITIEPINPNEIMHEDAPIEAAYKITVSILKREEYYRAPGVMYIDHRGEFVTNKNVAEKILKRSDYRRIRE